MTEFFFPWGPERELPARRLDKWLARLRFDAPFEPVAAAVDLQQSLGARSVEQDLLQFQRAGWIFQPAEAGEPIVGWDRDGTTAQVWVIEEKRMALFSDLVTVNFKEVVGREEARDWITDQQGLRLTPVADPIQQSSHFRARLENGQDFLEVLGDHGDVRIEPELLEVIGTQPIGDSDCQVPHSMWPWQEQDFNNGRGGSTSVLLAQAQFNVDGAGTRIAVLDDGFCFRLPSFAPSSRLGLVEVRTPGLQVRERFPNRGDHGARCASMAAGANVNDYRGAAPGADLLLARLRGAGTVDPTSIDSQPAVARLIEYCLDPGKFAETDAASKDAADVVASSLGGRPTWRICQCLSTVLTRCGNEGRRGSLGTPVFWAVSNRDSAPTADHEVVAHPQVAGISACGPNAVQANAAVGDDLELLAPGVCTQPVDCRGYYPTVSGTSLAAPVVAGIAALLVQQKSDLSVADLRRALRETASHQGSRTPTRGYGVVNALKALSSL